MKVDGTIGKIIRDFRLKKKFSQLNLELKLGMAFGSISRLEANKINPTKETLIKLIEELDIDALSAAIVFSKDYVDDFTAEDVLLRTFCENVATAITNAQKYEILKQKVH